MLESVAKDDSGYLNRARKCVIFGNNSSTGYFIFSMGEMWIKDSWTVGQLFRRCLHVCNIQTEQLEGPELSLIRGLFQYAMYYRNC